jgi:hypothetical protein
MLWTGLIWLRIGTDGGLLWTRYLNFGYHKMLVSSWVDAQMAASQERLSSTKFVSYCALRNLIIHKTYALCLLTHIPVPANIYDSSFKALCTYAWARARACVCVCVREWHSFEDREGVCYLILLVPISNNVISIECLSIWEFSILWSILLAAHPTFFWFFYFISGKFTIYSTNGVISKYVIRKHLCRAIIQWWFSYVYCTLCWECVYSSSSLWSFKSEGHCRFSLRLTFNGLLNSVT